MTLDARGNAVQSDRYSSGGSPTLLTSTQRGYDALNRLTSTRGLLTPGTVGGGDAITTLEYDRLGQLTGRIVTTGGSPNETDFEYDGAGRIVTITDPDGYDTEYLYDAVGNRTKVYDPADEPTDFEFDADRRQTKATLANGDFVTMSLDIRGLETDVENYASGAGTPLTHTKYSYDAAGRVTATRRKVNPGGADVSGDIVTQSEFDGGGRLTATVSASGNDTTYDYDPFDRITKAIRPDGSYEMRYYDLEDTVTKSIVYEIVDGSTHALETRRTLDALGRVTERRNHGPDATYGNADDITMAYFYDDAGRQTKTLDELGKESDMLFDALGRRTQTVEDAANLARDSHFEYDRAGRLLEVIAENDANGGDQTTVYAYNGRDLPEVVTYEETGDVSMFYDERGSLTLRVDEAGTSVDYAYDSVNRLSQRAKSGATDEIEQYVYDGVGRMVTARKGTSGDNDADSLSVFSFDARSLLQSEQQKIGDGSAKTVYSAYDDAGRRNALTYHDDLATVTYTYDTRDRCSTVDLGGSRLADYTWFGRGLAARDVTMDYPGGTKPQFATVFERDGVWRVTTASNTLLTEDQADTFYSNLGAWDYSYDKASNPLDNIPTGDDIGLNEQDHEFSYDSLYRLSKTFLIDTLDWTTASASTSTYEFDLQGNRISHSYRDGAAIVYEHNKANQMTGLDGLTPGYDLAGNQTLAYSVDRGSSYVYKYDHNNRLTGVYDSTGTTRKAAYSYDALARRVEYIDDVNGQTSCYYYDGANEIVETGGDGTAKRWYVHGRSYIDERLAMYSVELARPFYYALDRMYNVRGLVDRAGALVETVFYDGFGRPLIRCSPGRNDMDNDGDIDSKDESRAKDARNGNIWDPRADGNDDGTSGSFDDEIFGTQSALWNTIAAPSVQRAVSHFGNPFLWQGRPQFVFDTERVEDDGSSYDTFGYSVALSGDDLVVGAPLNGAGGSDAGVVFVYRWVDDKWEARQRLLASDAGSGDYFGTSVSIDGDTLVVGAPYEDQGGTNAGAAYVFVRTNGVWTQHSKLKITDAGAQFGTAVAIDDDVIAVGAPFATESSNDIGKVVVYRLNTSSWSLEQTLDADTDTQDGAQFGSSVAVNGDVIAVGAPAHDVSGNSNRGKFYIFRYDSGGSSWSEDANYAPSSNASDWCGISVGVYGDYVVAGSPYDDSVYTNAGAAYVVEYDSGAATWGTALQLTASDAGANDEYGQSVAISGGRIVIGSPRWTDSGSDLGATYVYDYDGTTPWDETDTLTASDGTHQDYFGGTVAVDGDRVVASAWHEDTFGYNSGAAYTFDLDGTWSQTAKITAELPTYAEEAVVVIIDHRLRMYDPVTGKWLTRDPIGYLGGSWNIYEYVRNNPWRYSDPLGLVPDLIVDGEIDHEAGEVTIHVYDDGGYFGWRSDDFNTFHLPLEDPTAGGEPRTFVWVTIGNLKFKVKLRDLREWAEEDLNNELSAIHCGAPSDAFMADRLAESFLKKFHGKIYGMRDAETGLDLPGWEQSDPANLNLDGILENSHTNEVESGVGEAATQVEAGLIEVAAGFMLAVGVEMFSAARQIAGTARSMRSVAASRDIELKNPKIKWTAQVKHMDGTPGRSQFLEGLDVEATVRHAWDYGEVLYNKNGVPFKKVYYFESPVGYTPDGVPQHYVHVHWSINGDGIHGVPSTSPG